MLQDYRAVLADVKRGCAKEEEAELKLVGSEEQIDKHCYYRLSEEHRAMIGTTFNRAWHVIDAGSMPAGEPAVASIMLPHNTSTEVVHSR